LDISHGNRSENWKVEKKLLSSLRVLANYENLILNSFLFFFLFFFTAEKVIARELNELINFIDLSLMWRDVGADEIFYFFPLPPPASGVSDSL